MLANTSAVQQKMETRMVVLWAMPQRTRVSPWPPPFGARGQVVGARVESRFFKLDWTQVDVIVQGVPMDFEGAPATCVTMSDITELNLYEGTKGVTPLMLNLASSKDARIALFVDPGLPTWIVSDSTLSKWMPLSNATSTFSGTPQKRRPKYRCGGGTPRVDHWCTDSPDWHNPAMQRCLLVRLPKAWRPSGSHVCRHRHRHQ